MHWPNSLGLIEGFCTACEQPWVDLNTRPFALKVATLTTVPQRPHTKFDPVLYGLMSMKLTKTVPKWLSSAPQYLAESYFQVWVEPQAEFPRKSR